MSGYAKKAEEKRPGEWNVQGKCSGGRKRPTPISSTCKIVESVRPGNGASCKMQVST